MEARNTRFTDLPWDIVISELAPKLRLESLLALSVVSKAYRKRIWTEERASNAKTNATHYLNRRHYIKSGELDWSQHSLADFRKASAKLLSCLETYPDLFDALNNNPPYFGTDALSLQFSKFLMFVFVKGEVELVEKVNKLLPHLLRANDFAVLRRMFRYLLVEGSFIFHGRQQLDFISRYLASSADPVLLRSVLAQEDEGWFLNFDQRMRQVERRGKWEGLEWSNLGLGLTIGALASGLGWYAISGITAEVVLLLFIALVSVMPNFSLVVGEFTAVFEVVDQYLMERAARKIINSEPDVILQAPQNVGTLSSSSSFFAPLIDRINAS